MILWRMITDTTVSISISNPNDNDEIDPGSSLAFVPNSCTPFKMTVLFLSTLAILLLVLVVGDVVP